MPDDGFRYELVRGELRKMPPAGSDHGKFAGRIGARLGTYAMDSGLGDIYIADTGFKLALDPDHVLAPDAAFVRRERASRTGESPGFFPGPPDMAVEVIWPSDTYSQVAEKVADWLRFGTRAVIVVDPRRRTVAVHRSPSGTVTLSEGDTLAVEDVLPGWRMPVREVFE